MSSSPFEHQRHKPPTALARPRELIVACPPMRSQVNLSRIARVAGCCGIERMIICGGTKVDPKIVRNATETLRLETRRSLVPVLERLKSVNFRLVGLEQTTNSQSLFEYRYERRTVLVPGNERSGLTAELLELMDDTVEIPVYGKPDSYNVATATAMALYEYCRQFPKG